jgi:hypothetical protein
MLTPRRHAKRASEGSTLRQKAPVVMTAKLGKLTWTPTHRHRAASAKLDILQLLAL